MQATRLERIACHLLNILDAINRAGVAFGRPKRRFIVGPQSNGNAAPAVNLGRHAGLP